MKLESIKNLNITGLFLSPIDHLTISTDGVVSLFSKGGNSNKNVIEAPGLKMIILPDLKKEFVFENIRVLINDRSEVLPEKTSLLDDFHQLINKNYVDPKKLSAYGFNFDGIVVPEETFKVSDLIGPKISILPHISNAGVNVNFEKDGIKYNFALTPFGDENQYLAHLNAHFSQDLPTDSELKNQFMDQFTEFKDIISKI